MNHDQSKEIEVEVTVTNKNGDNVKVEAQHKQSLKDRIVK